ncbi:hypothetical protein HanLR1_Chr12g0465051 [Helianthus annuus]|nr:hypothetical protein HanHA89_Chr12g0488491 [Helianthus annuus]KAJ0676641.1 hypothetical protein HanLR1_Chr12g0465051 [Helianthus annuus]
MVKKHIRQGHEVGIFILKPLFMSQMFKFLTQLPGIFGTGTSSHFPRFLIPVRYRYLRVKHRGKYRYRTVPVFMV